MKTGNKTSGNVRVVAVDSDASLASQTASFTGLNPSANYVVAWRAANNATNTVSLIHLGETREFDLPAGSGTTARLRQVQFSGCTACDVSSSSGGDVMLIQTPDLYTSAPNADDMNYRFDGGTSLIENELATVLAAN